MSAFDSFPARLREAIVARLGWTSLRPVQELAAEAIVPGKNAVVLAPTAGGKTEAAMFPVLAGLIERPASGVGAIYVAPIKALLNNQEDRLGTYAEMVGLRRFVWHGDAKESDKRRFLKEPAEILMTTPESLEVMLLSSRADAPSLFRDLRVVVVDEVHALAGTDRGAHLASVIERLAALSSHDVQRVGLSATVGNPADILAWLAGSSGRKGTVVDPPKTTTRRELWVSLHDGLPALSQAAAARAAGKKSLFFCQSRSLTEAVAERMRAGGTEVFVHHSSVSADERHEAEERFHHGENACIVCTSTLELGIDVGDLDLVLQANAPSSVSSFLQRMGRTGRRAGQSANTAFLCESPEAALQAVAVVELARARWVESVAVTGRCWPVLVHQTLVMTLQHDGPTADEIWSQLSRVPDFAGVSRGEYDTLLASMKQHEYLFEAGSRLSLGPKAERVFGKKNFLALFAVFSSPALYRVETVSGRDLGSLEQGFVDSLAEGSGSFLLAGRAWQVERVVHEDRVIKVREASGGQKPTWGGFSPQMLSFELCQSVRRVLGSDATYPYVDPLVMASINERRADLGPLLGRPGPAVQMDGDSARWWTFAGGRINHTLKYALELTQGWKVTADNFQLRIDGDGVSHESVRAAVAALRGPGLWESPEWTRQLMAKVPPYRLSKFQAALPDAMVAEMLGATMLDVAGARGLLEG